MATALRQEDGEQLDERTQAAFLRRVRIQGYKSITLCDVHLEPFTVLVGRNGAGKSNFLDALAFLRDLMEMGVGETVKRRGGLSAILCRTAANRMLSFEVSARIDLPGPAPRNHCLARYALDLSTEEGLLPSITRERLEIHTPDERRDAGYEVHKGTISRWRPFHDLANPEDLPDSPPLFAVYRPDRPLLSVIATPPFHYLADGLRSMGFYNFSPEEIRRQHTPAPGWLLEKNGSNLASAIDGLKQINPDAIQRVREYLAAITEEVVHFDVVRYGEYETIRFRVRRRPGEPALEFDAINMSDGTLRALASLIAAFQIVFPLGPGMIGIEEPETALHPAATHALVSALQEATAHTQILLTTHSADLLTEVNREAAQVLVVRIRNGQTVITPVDPASREILRKDLYTLADLQRMDQLDLDEEDLRRQAQGWSNGKE